MTLDPIVPIQPEVILGEDETLIVTLNKPDRSFFNITGATEIDCLFLKNDATCLHKRLTVVGEVTIIDALMGKFAINLTAVDTAMLALSPKDGYSHFEVRVTIAGKIYIAQFRDAIKVIPSLFPSC